MIDWREFDKVIEREKLGKVTGSEGARIILNMADEEEYHDLAELGAQQKVRNHFRETKDDDGNRVYHNVGQEDGERAYKSTQLFDDRDWIDLIGIEEEKARRQIKKTMALRDQAHKERNIWVELSFNLELVEV